MNFLSLKTTYLTRAMGSTACSCHKKTTKKTKTTELCNGTDMFEVINGLCFEPLAGNVKLVNHENV